MLKNRIKTTKNAGKFFLFSFTDPGDATISVPNLDFSSGASGNAEATIGHVEAVNLQEK